MTALRDTLLEGSGELVTRSLEGQVLSPQMSLFSSRGAELLLRFVPAIIAGSGAQGEHGIDVGGCPMHPGSLEARLHHHFVAAFHDA